MPGSRLAPLRAAMRTPGSAMSPVRRHNTLLLALSVLLLLQPPSLDLLLRPSSGNRVPRASSLVHAQTRHRVQRAHGPHGGAAAGLSINIGSDDDSDADVGGGVDRGGGGRGPLSADCKETCYKGLLEGTFATCKAQEYDPGLVKMLTDARTRRAAQSFHGDRTRLRAALKRFADGADLVVAVAGGSISAGQGAVDAPSYPKWMQFVLDANLPHKGRARVHNGAVPGTSSQYMSSCHNVHVPREADIIIVEYAVNDDEMPMPHMNNQVRRPYERLLRKLLNYPNRPAVILLHGYRWFQIPVEGTGLFWSSGERQQSEFGVFYGLPQVSIKACCYHYMVEGKPGFQVKRPRADQHGRIQVENGVDSQLKDFAFYYDVVHPDGHTGHRVMGEVAAQLILDAWADVAAGWTPSAEDLQVMNAPLPPPMLPDNLESAVDKCFIGPAFQKTMIERDGFEWVNEGKNPAMPKWGYVATEPGKVIKFKVNTKSARAAQNDAKVTVELGYLRSYENMGRAEVQCEGGCTCAPWTLDGHHDQHNSQTFLHPFTVSQAEECIVHVRVLQDSSSGKHKVKITGIMVSEEPDSRAFQNWAAFDWVSVASSKDPNGVFEISNTARRMLFDWNAASSAELQQRYYETLAARPGIESAADATSFLAGIQDDGADVTGGSGSL